MSHAQEVEDDRLSWAASRGPELTVFAHKEDAEDALPIEAVASEIHLCPETQIIATSRRRRDILYGFALATTSAVRLVQEDDQADQKRRRGLPFPHFIAHMQHLMSEPQARSDTTGHEPVRWPTVGPPAPTIAPFETAVTNRSGAAPANRPASRSWLSKLRRLIAARKTQHD